MDYSPINRALLSRLSALLNDHARCIDLSDLRALSSECALTTKEAYSFLLASMLGLEIDTNPEHRLVFERYFPEMIRPLDAAVYRADPYYQKIHIPHRKMGRWEMRAQSYAPCEAFVCGDMRREADGRVIAPIGFFEEEFTYPCVLEDGREWMLITPNEIETMRPAITKVRGNVLAYGLGLGYFAYMTSEKTEVCSITVVERDEDVIRLFNDHILPQFPHRKKIHIVQDDAFSYACNVAPQAGFDFIFTDLWHDAGDGVALYLRMKELEPLCPSSRFMYWIEPTLRCYIEDI